MDRLVAMRVFVEVADRGSLIAAADHRDMSRAMVSRYLAELEQWVGVRLLHRTTRKLSLTSAGSQTLPRCRQMLDMAGDIQASAATPEDTPRGTLRLTRSMSSGQAYLAPLLARFLKRYPGTAVSILMVDRAVNLIEERVDLTLHSCLTYSDFGKSLWEFNKGGVPVAVPVGGNMSANESSVLLKAAVSDAGISMQPLYAAAIVINYVRC